MKLLREVVVIKKFGIFIASFIVLSFLFYKHFELLNDSHEEYRAEVAASDSIVFQKLNADEKQIDPIRLKDLVTSAMERQADFAMVRRLQTYLYFYLGLCMALVVTLVLLVGIKK